MTADRDPPPTGRIVFTDPNWRPNEGGLTANRDADPLEALKVRAATVSKPDPALQGWNSPTAGTSSSTVTPPAAAEPVAAAQPTDRLRDAENALMAARRNLVNALDWAERALMDVRKLRAGQ